MIVEKAMFESLSSSPESRVRRSFSSKSKWPGPRARGTGPVRPNRTKTRIHHRILTQKTQTWARATTMGREKHALVKFIFFLSFESGFHFLLANQMQNSKYTVVQFGAYLLVDGFQPQNPWHYTRSKFSLHRLCEKSDNLF